MIIGMKLFYHLRTKTMSAIPTEALHVILYFTKSLEKLGIELSETKLYKLLRFTSLEFADTWWSVFLEDIFVKKQYGPVPIRICNYINDIKNNDSLESKFIEVQSEEKQGYTTVYVQNTIVARRDPDTNFLTESMIQAMDTIIQKYANRTAKTLSDLSHGWKARNAAKDEEMIDISLDMNNEKYKELVREQQENMLYFMDLAS